MEGNSGRKPVWKPRGRAGTAVDVLGAMCSLSLLVGSPLPDSGTDRRRKPLTSIPVSRETTMMLDDGDIGSRSYVDEPSVERRSGKRRNWPAVLDEAWDCWALFHVKLLAILCHDEACWTIGSTCASGDRRPSSGAPTRRKRSVGWRSVSRSARRRSGSGPTATGWACPWMTVPVVLSTAPTAFPRVRRA